MRFSMVFVILMIFSGLLLADEGMWMPHQMEMLDLEKEGLEMDPADLYKPNGTGLMSAVVDLGGGTASFVSDKGLIFTNHHVAYGAIQRSSTPEHNYLENGFLARNLGEEILAPGYTAGVLIKYEEVTKKIHGKLKNDMSPMERYEAIDKAKKALIAEAESKATDRYAEIASMYSGNQYYLFEYKKLKDVRIVYAPPRSLGNYGGEVDNWMWPRHTADFTFLRAYVSPEGVGVEYSEDNVPYEPKIHFKIAEKGVKPGDFTFIMGYPGRTYRNYTAPEVKYDIERMKESIEERLEFIEFFENASENNEEIEIKYASKIKGLYNGLKNYRGKLEGFEKINLMEKKKAADDNFQEWVNEKRRRKKEYKGIIEKIGSFLEEEYKPFRDKESGLSGLASSYYGSALIGKAHLLVRIALEGEKPDEERDSYYQARNLPNIKRRLQFTERSYDKIVDQKFAVLRLNNYIAENKGNLPEFLTNLLEEHGSVEAWAKMAYAETKLADTDYGLELFTKSVTELKAEDDPMINLAFAMEKELAELREKSHEIGQQLKDLKMVYKNGLLAMNDNQIAPDANSTIRFTYGPVKGYSPRDAVYYEPITTIKGVAEKHTGEKPFDAPAKFLNLIRTEDYGPYADENLGSVPACFLNVTNVTGGNSGSPTINAKGEVTGIIFDMTYESVTGDYYIVPDMQRVISADIRYVLFVTDKFAEADYLLDEMKVK
ncbi:MAG: S46 family peptidase [Fidelibacterota bacterium]